MRMQGEFIGCSALGVGVLDVLVVGTTKLLERHRSSGPPSFAFKNRIFQYCVGAPTLHHRDAQRMGRIKSIAHINDRN